VRERGQALLISVQYFAGWTCVGGVFVVVFTIVDQKGRQSSRASEYNKGEIPGRGLTEIIRR